VNLTILFHHFQLLVDNAYGDLQAIIGFIEHLGAIKDVRMIDRAAKNAVSFYKKINVVRLLNERFLNRN
jgi:hypothetical protein